MAKQKETVFEDYYAVLDNGKVVRINFREDLAEDVWKALRSAWVKGDIFNEEGWSDLTMELDGENFNQLNCSRVIGIR